MTLRRLVSALLLLAGLLVGGTPALAHPDDPHVCLVRIPAGASADSIIAQPEKMDCASNQIDRGAGNFVARLNFHPVRPTADAPMVLRLPSLWQDEVKVHFRYADGSEAVTGFSSKTAARNLTIGAVFEVPVPVRQAALTSALIEVRGAANLRGVVLGPRLVSSEQAYLDKLLLVMIYAQE